MKAMKVMKKITKTRKVAKGKLSMVSVFKGKFEKTVGGLKREDLTRSKTGRVVSKKRSAIGKRHYEKIQPWVEACKRAKAELGLTGFVPMRKGTPVYTRAREIYDA